MGQPNAIDGRFTVIAPLGKGGMGSVYRVRDSADGVERALKLFEEARVSGARRESATRRFRREFHTMKELAHPRVVRVFDYGIDARGPYYTMELLDGHDLADVGALTVREACTILRDVASALAFLHARRLVHRDVAPRNVRVTSDGRAKLIDFGVLATPGIAGDVAGTPPCIAPEAVRGLPIDHRTDLYGLGALAYWLLTRRHAYPASEIAQLENAWRVRPQPPAFIRADVPPALDELVVALLSRDPLARPATAAEVIDRLASIGDLPRLPETEVARGWLASATLVGRQREMEKIRARVLGLATRRGGAIVIQAPSGMGKSRLLAEACVEGQLAGALPARVESATAQRGAYGVVRDLARGLLLASRDDALAAGRAHASIIGRVLPELVEAIGDVTLEPASEDPAEDRLRLQEALSAFFVDFSRRRPIVLAVDDVQRCDEASAAALAATAHAAKEERALVVVALRTDEEPRAAAAIASLRDAGSAIRLRGLDAHDVEDLTRALFGEGPGIGRLARWIRESADGSPLRCTELARHLVDHGVVRYADGLWLVAEDLGGTELPRGLAEAMDSRIAGLDASARRLGEALAVQGGVLPLDLCVALADTKDEAAVFASLDALVFDEVLVGSGETFHFRHDGLREALIRGLDDERRRALHLRAGEVLTARAEGDPEREGEIGWHLLRGGDVDHGAGLLEQAGRALYAAQSFGDAIPLLEAAVHALEARPRVPERRRLELRHMLVHCGVIHDRAIVLRYADGAISALERWSGMDTASRWRPRVGRLLALVIGAFVAVLRWIFTSRLSRGPSPLAAMTSFATLIAYTATVRSLTFDTDAVRVLAAKLEPLTALGARIPAATYRLALCYIYIPLGLYARVRVNAEWALRALARDRITPLPDVEKRMGRGACHFMVASCEAIQTNPVYLHELERLDRLNLRFFAASTWSARSIYHRLRGEEDSARAAADTASVLFVQLGNAWVFESQRQWISSLACALTGDVLGLKRAVEELEELSRTNPHLAKFAALARAEYFRERGDHVAAREAITRMIADLADDDTFCRQFALAARAEIELAAGDHESAERTASEGMALGESAETGIVVPRARSLRALALAEAARGETTTALRRLDEASKASWTNANPAIVGALHDARARISLGSGDRADFELHRLETERAFRATKNPVLIARAERLLEAGEAARDSIAPPSIATAEAVTAVYRTDAGTRASRVLAECRGKHERAERSLSLLLEDTGAAAGYLMLLRQGELELAAPLHGQEPDDALVASLLGIALVSRGGGEETVVETLPAHSTRGQFRPILITTTAGVRRTVVGVAALAEGSTALRAPDDRLIEAIARAARDAGDVTTDA